MVGWRCQLFAPKEFTFYTGIAFIFCLFIWFKPEPYKLLNSYAVIGQWHLTKCITPRTSVELFHI